MFMEIIGKVVEMAIVQHLQVRTCFQEPGEPTGHRSCLEETLKYFHIVFMRAFKIRQKQQL